MRIQCLLCCTSLAVFVAVLVVVVMLLLMERKLEPYFHMMTRTNFLSIHRMAQEVDVGDWNDGRVDM